MKEWKNVKNKEDKLLESHLETEHGIKTKTIKQFSGGMMFMMVE